MNKTPLVLLLGLCGAGLLSGVAARRLTRGPAVATAPAGDLKTRSPGASEVLENSVSPAARSTPPSSPRLRSVDTLETLAALDAGSLYGRLADWLLDASERDIAAYWATYQIGKRSNDITDLVFLNWTRVNPRAAIAATAGGKDEHYAWWAWACHDPKGSLAAALAANPDRVNNVAWGIGEFHPEWLRAHFKEIPEAARGNALSGMSKWNDGENPLEMLKFLKENGESDDAGNFKALALKDPWAALDWIRENPGRSNDPFAERGANNERMRILLSTMSTERPDDLRRLAEQTPSGELKRAMEAALFDNLLATDPEAAIEQAKSTDSPVIAAQRCSQIGLSLLKSDPDKAFEMGATLLTGKLSSANNSVEVDYPNGSSSWGGSQEGVTDLLSALIAKDPARVMAMAIGPGEKPSNAFNSIANQWATQDLVSYSQWVNQQTDPDIRKSAVTPIVNELAQLNQFSEAADWAMTTDHSSLNNVFYPWKRADPEGAAVWLEASNLPENEKVMFRRILHPKQSSEPAPSPEE